MESVPAAKNDHGHKWTVVCNYDRVTYKRIREPGLKLVLEQSLSTEANSNHEPLILFVIRVLITFSTENT